MAIDLATPIKLSDLLSLLLGLVAAAIALYGGYRSIKASRINQERRQAFDAYNTYLTDCLANPELASGDVKLPKDDEHGWTHEFYKYQWRVARFLGAAEEVLRSSPKEDYNSWHQAIAGDAYWHRHYFASRFFEEVELKMYSPAVQKIIEAERERANKENRGAQARAT